MKNLIVFSIDDKYIEPFIVAIKSFSLYHEVEKYTIGLIYHKLSKKNIDRISDFSKSINIEINLEKIEDIFVKYKTGYHFNSVIFYRLLIPKIFSKYNKSIYLDSDIIFLGNIDYLFELNIDGYVVGVVERKDRYDIPKHMRSYTDTYFASGLLLLNHQEFSNKKIYEKSIYFLENYNYEMPDQDALNFAISDDWIYWLPYEYGVLTHESSFNRSKLDQVKILQFCGSQKPWHYGNTHICKDIYLEIWSKTPLYNRRFLIIDNFIVILKSIKKRLNNVKSI